MLKKHDMNVLVVDDEPAVRDFLSRFFKFEGIGLKCAQDSAKAIDAASQEKFDIIFIDVKMSGMNGVELLEELKKINANAVYVMMTGYAVDDMLKEAEKKGAIVSLKKPFEIGEIKKIIAGAKK